MLIKGFLFTINAAAIRLPVEIKGSGNIDPFLPSFPEIAVKKRETEGIGQSKSCIKQGLMILITTVEKRGGKGVKSIFSSIGSSF